MTSNSLIDKFPVQQEQWYQIVFAYSGSAHVTALFLGMLQKSWLFRMRLTRLSRTQGNNLGIQSTKLILRLLKQFRLKDTLFVSPWPWMESLSKDQRALLVMKDYLNFTVDDLMAIMSKDRSTILEELRCCREKCFDAR